MYLPHRKASPNPGTLIALAGIALALSTLLVPFYDLGLSGNPSDAGYMLAFIGAIATGILFFFPIGLFGVLPYLCLVGSVYYLVRKKPHRAAVSAVIGTIFGLIGTLIIEAIAGEDAGPRYGYYLWFVGAVLIVVGSTRIRPVDGQPTPIARTKSAIESYSSVLLHAVIFTPPVAVAGRTVVAIPGAVTVQIMMERSGIN